MWRSPLTAWWGDELVIVLHRRARPKAGEARIEVDRMAPGPK
jgi:hypothetical protein